jgi:transcriptional regulator with GAF, ATPase, and Fis domain
MVYDRVVVDSSFAGRPTHTSTRDDATARVHVRSLEVVHGPDAPFRMILDERPLVIGREPQGDGSLVLHDREVSRRHATIRRDERSDVWWASDEGSHNGSFVDGKRTLHAPLRHGTVLRVGGSILLFLEHEVDTRPAAPRPSALLGASAALARVRDEIDLAAPSAVPVLVLGETGVGKELVASEIHARSRRTGPFVAINCAGIPAELAETELFGHVPGAFTGASTRGAEGLFQAARGGTLFLDEIGELPLAIQPKLLRALAVGEVRPVGASDVRKVDVRVVAATHRPLDETSFRPDLRARLEGWTIRIPPLRERREDVVPLAQAFLARVSGAPLSADACEAMLLHDWPRNVRELEQTVNALAIRSHGLPTLPAAGLPAEIRARLGPRDKPRGGERAEVTPPASAPPPGLATAGAPTPADADVAPERDELVALLTEAHGNVAAVAKRLGKDRQQIYRWVRRYEIDLDSVRGAPPGEG